MTRRLFDHDPLTGTTQWFIPSEDESRFTIQTVQSTQALADANRASFNAFSSGRDRWGEHFGRRTRVASIPLAIYEDLRKRGILRDPPAFRRWLNDPDNAVFRTRPGVV